MPNVGQDEIITDKTFWLLGDEITIKVSGKETDGSYSTWEIVAPSNSGPPPHYHTNLTEGFYVLEGEFTFQHGDDAPIVAKRGSFVYVPGGTVHTYKNTGSQQGRLFVIGAPAGFEYFFAEAGMPIEQAKAISSSPNFNPDIKRLLEISKKYGVVYVPEIQL